MERQDTASVWPTLGDVREAGLALRGIAMETPLLRCAHLDEVTGGRILVKAEVTQRTGSFKIRGAYNAIRQLDAEQKRRGVVSFSSGNHAQAVAAAARLCDTPAVIVMPSTAPEVKIARTRDLGGEVVLYDPATARRDELAERIRQDRNLVMIPPFDDARIIAGAGTLALETIGQLSALGEAADIVLVPCGGGGLSSGTALVFHDLSPETRLYAVEPEQFDDTRRSLAAGTRLANADGRHSICDALQTPMPGKLTFEINSQRLAGVATVSDDEVQAAMKFGFDHLKIVIEPGGAVGLAALLAGKVDASGRCIVVIASGGNVDAAAFCDAYKTQMQPPE